MGALKQALIHLTALILLVSAGNAFAWPADSDWIPIYKSSTPLQDDATDENGSRNLVGDFDPSVYVFNDGSYIHWRFRLDDSPLKNATELSPFGWGLLLDTDGNAGDYEFMVMLDGIDNPDQLYLAQNTTQGTLGDASDKPETIVWQQNADNTAGTGNFQVTTACAGATCYSGDDDFFLDFKIPYSVFTSSLGVGDNDLIRYFFGTSNSTQSLTVDLSGSDLYTGTSDFTLPTGKTPTDGTITFATTLGGTTDDTQFYVSETIYITVTDDDQNSQASTAETVTVNVETHTGDSETVTLTETGVDTGVFAGSITTTGLPLTVGDGTLQVDPIEFVTATYVDANDASYNSNVNRTDTIEALPVADLEVTKTVDNNTPNEGDTIIYTVTLTNNGPTDSLSAQVTDSLPTGVTYVSHTVSAGSYNASTGLWAAGSLVNGSSSTLAITATVDSGTAQTVITNTAAISSAGQPDSDTSNDSDSVNISVQGADLAVTKTVDNNAPANGGSVTFTVTVTNNGANSASNIEVTDALPAGLSYSSHTASGTTSYNSGTGLWSVGSLAVSASETLTLTASVTAAAGTTVVNTASITNSDQADPDSGNDSASATLYVGGADLAVTKSVSNASPDEGDNIFFTITVTNNGPNDATTVTVADTLPTGLQYDNTNTNATQGSYSSGTNSWSVGSLTSGSSATLYLYADVKNNTAGQTLTNTASVSGDQLDPDSGNNSDSASLTVSYADLAVTKSVDNSTPNNGDTITFTIVVTNNGPADATNVEVTDYIPSYLTNITTITGYPTQGTFATGTGIWTVGGLTSGSSATLQFSGDVTLKKSDPTSFYNSVEITASDQADPITANDTDSTVVKVAGLDLALSKSVDNATPNEGGTITYTVTLTNNGPNAATGVTVEDALPTGLTFSSATPGIGSYDSNKGEWVFGNSDSLASGASTTLTITATVDAGTTGQTLTNTASLAAADQGDTNIANDTASVNITIGAADLGLSKSVDNAAPTEGDTVVYTVTLTNSGPNNATNIQVTDQLPTGVTYVSDTGGGNYVSGTGIWTVASLANGASTSFTITATVDTGTAGTTITNSASITAADNPDSNSANNSASADIVVQRADLSVSKNVDHPTPYENHNITFSVTANNLGPHNATGVTVTDIIPAGLTFVSSSATVGSYDSGTGVWTIGALAKGSTANLTFVVTIDAGTAGTNITNTATISGDQADNNSSNNSSSVTITPQELQIDLSVSKTVDNASPDEGTNITYTIAVTNSHATESDTGVQLTDSLPAELTFVSYTADKGTYDNSTGIWNIGSIASGNTLNLQIVASVPVQDWSAGPTITNTASITATDFTDPNSANDSSSVDITPQDVPLPTLTILKSADKASATPGDTINYTIQITNTGDGQGLNVVIMDRLSGYTALNVGTLSFTEGTPASGLTLGTPEYSNDGGTSWSYTPAGSGVDPNITHWRVPMSGNMAVGGKFYLQYQAEVQ